MQLLRRRSGSVGVVRHHADDVLTKLSQVGQQDFSTVDVDIFFPEHVRLTVVIDLQMADAVAVRQRQQLSIRRPFVADPRTTAEEHCTV